MIISIDAEIASDKNPTLCHDKNMKQTRNSGSFLNLIKSIHEKSTANIILISKRPKALFLKSGKPRCPLSPLLFNIVLEVLVREIKQENKIKGIQIRKK